MGAAGARAAASRVIVTNGVRIARAVRINTGLPSVAAEPGGGVAASS
jgi:hypothetical protein